MKKKTPEHENQLDEIMMRTNEKVLLRLVIANLKSSCVLSSIVSRGRANNKKYKVDFATKKNNPKANSKSLFY
jgi:hypothetical protein